MSDPNKTVFISYRRSTSQDLARSIFMDLRANGWDAFFDVNTIDSGMFDRIILNQIAARAHFILVLSPGSLERCANGSDWLRREIEEAMRLNRNIVPVMKEGFSFETEKQFLPESIQDLPRFNALRVPHDYFDEAMEKLRGRFLKQPFYGEVVPTPPQEIEVVRRKLNEAVIVDAPVTADDYMNRGNERKKNGDYEGAIADFSEAIRLFPDYAGHYTIRGRVYQEKGDIDGAIADYSEAIHLDPERVAAYFWRGTALMRKGDEESINRAIADLERYLSLGGGQRNQEAKSWIDTLKRTLEQKTYSASSSPEAFMPIETDQVSILPQPGKPMSAKELFNRGNVKYNQKDYRSAIADFTEAIHLNPQFAEAYVNRGLAREYNHDLDGAFADYSEAIRLAPENAAPAYTNRALVREERGDLDGALADYNEAIRLDPDNVNVYHLRGHTREGIGDLLGAMSDYQMYLDLDGGDTFGNQREIEAAINQLKAKLDRP